MLLTSLTPAGEAAPAFAVQRVALNLGIGLGGLTGGLIVSSADPSSFTVLFLVDAVTFVAHRSSCSRSCREPELDGALDGERQLGYRTVVKDRRSCSRCSG